MSDQQPLEPEVMAALAEGRKIEAIKILREKRGLGLKEAKELVEKHEDDIPSRSPNVGVTQIKNRNPLHILIFIAFLAYVAYHILE